MSGIHRHSGYSRLFSFLCVLSLKRLSGFGTLKHPELINTDNFFLLHTQSFSVGLSLPIFSCCYVRHNPVTEQHGCNTGGNTWLVYYQINRSSYGSYRLLGFSLWLLCTSSTMIQSVSHHPNVSSYLRALTPPPDAHLVVNTPLLVTACVCPLTECVLTCTHPQPMPLTPASSLSFVVFMLPESQLTEYKVVTECGVFPFLLPADCWSHSRAIHAILRHPCWNLTGKRLVRSRYSALYKPGFRIHLT